MFYVDMDDETYERLKRTAAKLKIETSEVFKILSLNEEIAVAKLRDCPIAEDDEFGAIRELLGLFEQANGYSAGGAIELVKWMVSPEGNAALAYDRTPDGKIIPS